MRSVSRAHANAAFILAVVFLIGCGGGGTSSGTPPAMVAPPGPSFPQVSGLAQRQATYQQTAYPFYVFVPSSYDGSRALPAVLLIHGSGGNGPGMVGAWQSFAEKNAIVLVAPTLPLGGTFETTVAPKLYPIIMDAVRGEWKVDARRIYLFGVSAGGYTVFDAGMLDSQYFAAGGVFAAVITPDYDWILQQATRKTPFATYIGDHDEFFTVAQAQRTRDVLQANGFPARLLIFPNLDHNYGAVADQVNSDVWSFFSQYPLPQ
jgi:polyhydroxybutyrate depolymerase